MRRGLFFMMMDHVIISPREQERVRRCLECPFFRFPKSFQVLHANNRHIRLLVSSVAKHQNQIFVFLTYFVIFLSLVFPYSDKDWGWHYRLGEHFIRTGHLLRTNPFTWTLPNYFWTNHEWLYDPLLYILYNAVGFLGLSILGGAAAFVTFFVITKPFELSYWKLAILGFFFIKLSEAGIREGLRSQVIANLLLAILLWVLIKARRTGKFLFTLPFLFLLWVNLHGTFVLGLGVMATFLARYFLIDRKRLVLYFSVGLAAAMVTLANPFGYNIYLEPFKHLTSPHLEYVLEWLPITQDCPYCHQYTFFIYVGLLAYIFFTKKPINALPYFVLSLMLLYPAISARRYLPIFTVITLPVLGTWLEALNANADKFRSARYLTILIITTGIMFNLFARYPNYHLYSYSEADYCYHAHGCSPAMADYLTEHPLEGRGFNFYDWGGYYIGKGIPEKLFVDGRMHLWSQNGYAPFVDFIAMYYFHDDKLFRAYEFDWVLVPLDSDIGQKILYSDDLGNWKMTSRDENTVLFTRP
jgi:hypothetical protein